MASEYGIAGTPEYSRAYYLANKDRIKARAAARYEIIKEQKAAAQRARAKADEFYWRAQRYRCDSEDLKTLFEEDGYACAVCGSTETLHVDHCHETKALRGVLCGNCNRALGILGEDPDRIEQLAKYARERCFGGDLSS